MATPPVCEFGLDAPTVSLPATDGRSYSIEDIRGPKGTLVMFICNHCPYVTGAIDRIVADAKVLQDAGIGVAAICSNDANDYPMDGFGPMGEFARTHGFTFPYLHDEDQRAASRFGAVCTPDFFGYNADLKLQYRGRLDEGGRRAVPDARRELVEAMLMIAETGKGPAEQTASMGCSIKWTAA